MSTLSALRMKQLGRLGLGIISGVGLATYMNTSMKCKDVPSNIGAYKNGLPEYSRSQISEHSNPSQRIWVSYREGVYDITDFIPKHPGGSEKIMMAAGGPLEPFWQIYQQHTGVLTQRLLEEMRIGNIKKDEPKLAPNSYDPYANEPKRPPFFKIRSLKPFNAETPMEFLTETYLTPNQLFYVRNHLPTPDLEEKEYNLEVSGAGLPNEVYLDLETIKTKFPKKCIDVAFSCAGNRRSDMADYKPVKGLDWEAGAIGNARWCGAYLVDVLSASGYKSGAKHVHFEGADLDPAGVAYAASIPVETAMDPSRQVLLAYEMNGEPLPRDHGYPIRAVVPGTVAARNVKWLQRVVTSVEECQGHWQQRDYKVFPADVKWGESAPAPPIQDMPVQSAICSPPDGTIIGNAEEVTVKGYAYSGGGRDIARVEVSPDGGRTWITASLKPKDVNEDPVSPWHQREWSWRLWEVKVPLELSRKKIDLCCKAVDVSYNTQPENVHAIWNIRGLLANSWHHVTLRRESTPTAGRIV